MTDAVACLGIQHPYLALHGQDDSIQSFCLQKWVYICRRWHSKDCHFVVERGSTKQRCAKCANACSNIKPSRYPKLYPEKKSSTSVSPIADVSPPEPIKQPTLHIGDLILSDVDALRRRMKELIDTVGEDENLSDNDEILLMAKVMKLKGQHTFDLEDKQVFVVCVGNECHACFVKKKRANVGTSCHRCIDKKSRDKLLGARKVLHKDMRVAANSNVPFSALDDKERQERLSNIVASGSHSVKQKQKKRAGGLVPLTKSPSDLKHKR